MGSNSRHYSHPAQSMTAGGDQLSEPLAPEEEGAEYGECGEEPENPNKAREAFLYCMLGVCSSIGVSVWIRYDQSTEAMMEFYAGYLVEMSLSLDNLFAFYLVFKYFKVHSEAAQNRVLFWGILGAIFLRGVMVVMGAAMIHTFRPLLLICAVVLIFSAYQVLIIGEDDDDDEDLSDNFCVTMASKIVPVNAGYHGADFVHEGKCTPLLPLHPGRPVRDRPPIHEQRHRNCSFLHCHEADLRRVLRLQVANWHLPWNCRRYPRNRMCHVHPEEGQRCCPRGCPGRLRLNSRFSHQFLAAKLRSPCSWQLVLSHGQK